MFSKHLIAVIFLAFILIGFFWPVLFCCSLISFGFLSFIASYTVSQFDSLSLRFKTSFECVSVSVDIIHSVAAAVIYYSWCHIRVYFELNVSIHEMKTILWIYYMNAKREEEKTPS